MKYQEECPYCGHIKTAFTHKLNDQLVKALRQLVDFYEREKVGCNLQKDLSLTKNQYNNFQKLQYFNLALKSNEGWFPSLAGISFIRGECVAWDRVATIESMILPLNHTAWDTHKGKKPVLVYIFDIDKSSWKTKEEYQAEKSRQEGLFK